MSVFYYEYYPHYMGTMDVTLKFTNKEFEELISKVKAMIKLHKTDSEAAYDMMDEIMDYAESKRTTKDTVFALMDALVDHFEKPRRPSTVANAIKKKGVWSGEWEEGSFAFATTERKARKAVAKIEAKHVENDMF